MKSKSLFLLWVTLFGTINDSLLAQNPLINNIFTADPVAYQFRYPAPGTKRWYAMLP